MVRAKSRLSSHQVTILVNSHHLAPSHRSAKSTQAATGVLQRYMYLLPTLFVGLIFLALVGAVFRYVHPQQIASLGLHDSYWPLLLVVFGAVFFITTFLLQNTRRGFLVAFFLCILLFLKVQAVLITPIELVIIGGSLLLIELTAKLAFKR